MSKLPRIPESDRTNTNKTIFFAVVLLLAFLVGGSLVYAQTSSTETENTEDVLSASVPSDVDYVVAVDPNSLAESELVSVAGEIETENPNYGEQRDEFLEMVDEKLRNQTQSLITREDIGDIAVFGNRYSGLNAVPRSTPPVAESPYSGALIEADLTFETVERLLDDASRITVETQSYNGQELLELSVEQPTQLPDTQVSNTVYFATLSESANVHAVGTENAVRDTIDKYQNKESPDGLRDQFGPDTLFYLDTDLEDPVNVQPLNADVDGLFINLDEDNRTTGFEVRLRIAEPDNFDITEVDLVEENEQISAFTNFRQADDEVILEGELTRNQLRGVLATLDSGDLPVGSLQG